MDFGEVPVDYVDGENDDFEEDDDDEDAMEGEVEESAPRAEHGAHSSAGCGGAAVCCASGVSPWHAGGAGS